jgi:hypothetical protein
MRSEQDAQLVCWIASGAGERRAAKAELCRRFTPRIRQYGPRHLRDQERSRGLVQKRRSKSLRPITGPLDRRTGQPSASVLESRG